VDETPSPQALTATSAPDAQATPTSASQAPATPTGEPAETATLNPIPTGTPAPGGDTTPTAAAPTRTWTSAPTPTPDLPPPDWDLARDVIGLWEYVEGDWRYCFDFFPDGRVSILGNGIRTYQVRDPRTLVIQVLEDEWVYPVVDLTYDHLTLEGVIDPAAQFARVEGTSNLADALVGLWLDLSGEFPSFEFTEEGVVVGEFGRGRYEVASPNSVLVTCDVPKDCAGYLVPGQPDGTPFAVRIYQVDDRSLSLQGLDRGQVWTIDRRGGYANLATGILGRWVNDGGSSFEFTEGGDWIVDDVRYGVYEVLSDSTIWGVLEGAGQALVITELTGTQLRYAEWGRFYMEDQRVYYRDPNSP
jgi:hypothetical protein